MFTPFIILLHFNVLHWSLYTFFALVHYLIFQSCLGVVIWFQKKIYKINVKNAGVEYGLSRVYHALNRDLNRVWSSFEEHLRGLWTLKRVRTRFQYGSNNVWTKSERDSKHHALSHISLILLKDTSSPTKSPEPVRVEKMPSVASLATGLDKYPYMLMVSSLMEN